MKPWIRSKVALFELNTYAAVVHKALIGEGESGMSQKEREGKKRKGEFPEGSQYQGNFQNHFNRRPGFQADKNVGVRRPEAGSVGQGNRPQISNQPRMQRPPLPECKICGKKHPGVCNKANIVCYKCNQKGHYANECQNQKAGTVCYKCGKLGHIAKDCKAPAPVNNMLKLT